MQHFLGWVIAASIVGASATAQATCKQTGRRRAVCSSPDGESYAVTLDGSPSTPAPTRPEVTAARQPGRLHFEAAVGPIAWISLPTSASARPAVGGEAVVRALYAWRPRARGIAGVGGALALAFVGDQLGAQLSGALAADGGPIGRARVGSYHRIALRRFWVPAILSALPSVGLVQARGTPARLELTTELPLGVVASKHLAVELRPGIFHRRGGGVDPTVGASLSLSLAVF